MTSRSRRKPRTTAPRTWGPGTACRLALLAALAGGPAAAQQPAPGRPAAVYGTPFPTTFGPAAGVPGGSPFAPPGVPPGVPYQPARPQPAAQPREQQPAPRAASPTGSPDAGVPAGYRSVGGGQVGTPRSERTGTAGGAGQVMYFHKPADALAVDGPAGEANPTPDPRAVAQISAPPVVAPAVSDVPAVPGIAPPPLPPASVADRPILGVPPVPLAVPAPVVQESPAQPAPAVQAVPEQPKADPVPVAQPMLTQPMPKAAPTPGPFLSPEVTQVPSPDKIFGMMYDDAALHKAIIERAKEDARRRASTGKGDKADLKLDGNWEFPALTPVVPAGTRYVTRTGTQPPVVGLREPGFVVHRRLHFEQKNFDRYGWDLGFVTPFVSAAEFYRDVLLWPNSLATGAVVGFWDTSAGKCLPGSPVPLYLYPPGLTITGGVTEGLVITGLSFIIP